MDRFAAHMAPPRRTGTGAPIVALIAVVAAAPAQARFCTDRVSDLPLSPDMLGPTAQLIIQDQGMVQIMSTASGFSQIEIFLGTTDATEAAGLRGGVLTGATLQADCAAERPGCRAETLITDRYVGTIFSYPFAGMVQSRIRIHSGDQSATIRVTAAGDDPDVTDRTARTVFDAMRPALTQC